MKVRVQSGLAASLLKLRAELTFLACCLALAAPLRAQNNTGQQTPCTDSLLQNCNNTGASGSVPTSSYPSANQNQNQNTGETQRLQDATGRLYVDSADNDSSRHDASRQNTDNRDRNSSLFPLDPVTDFQRLALASSGQMLPVFGRDFFETVPSTFAPGDQLAVSPDYIIGPGDDLLLRLWGPETFNSQLTVDRSGAIYLPKIGSIHVAGLRFDELKKQISTELGRTYRNFNVSVNLGRLRSIQVYVVGEARRPGAYTVSSLSTVLNALFASGGPNVQGSLRHIQVRRNGQVLPEFDLYDLVLRGDKSQDLKLESGDTIFIPPVGPQVAFAGSVRHPAIYELRNKRDSTGTVSTLGELLDLAGGFSSTASTAQILLERIEANQTRKALTIALDAEGKALALWDGDVLYAGHITAAFEQSVTIRGNLANPGRFPWHKGMRLSEIIPDRASLLTNDYWRERNRLGVPVPLFEPLPPTRNLQQTTSARNSTQNSTDAGTSRDSRSLNGDPAGARPYDRNDLDPQDLENNGRLTAAEAANLRANDTSGNRSSSAYDATPQSTATGNAVPGTLPPQNETKFSNDTQPRTSIRLNTPEIDWSYAAIERLNPDTLKSSIVPFNLGRMVQDHDPTQNIELQSGDVVTILSQNDILVPQDLQTKYVRLEGEFIAAGVYSVSPDETLDELVTRAGGLTFKAYLFGSNFTREAARVFQQQRLDEYITSLSADMERAAAVRTASSANGVVDPNALAEQRSLIYQLRLLRATGRIVLEFGPHSQSLASIPKIPLNNGDVFRVPAKPNTISVVGAVYGQNVFLYDGTRKLEDYVELAGNPNRIADRKHAFIIRADGSIYSRERAQRVFSNSFLNAEIYPGDAIVIPEKLVRPTALRNLIDFTQILSSFGLAAAAINVIR